MNEEDRSEEYPDFIFEIEDQWIIKINRDGIKFNREDFPQYTEDDFAMKFIDIVEGCLRIKFEKKKTIRFHKNLLEKLQLMSKKFLKLFHII